MEHLRDPVLHFLLSPLPPTSRPTPSPPSPFFSLLFLLSRLLISSSFCVFRGSSEADFITWLELQNLEAKVGGRFHCSLTDKMILSVENGSRLVSICLLVLSLFFQMWCSNCTLKWHSFYTNWISRFPYYLKIATLLWKPYSQGINTDGKHVWNINQPATVSEKCTRTAVII